MKTARVKAMDYLSRREHSRLELQRKLEAKGYTWDDISSTLDRLAEQGLQSDRRFAGAYIRSRSMQGYGPVRVRGELKQRGVAEVDYLVYFNEVDWRTICMQAWQKKFDGQKTKDYKLLAKQQRFMLQRGFVVEQIQSVIND